ncbi:MAG: AAA family ATPase [Betaproteobacteria bacterium]|nr:AAA family ATPase [Betaproteobacteria bacterium]
MKNEHIDALVGESPILTKVALPPRRRGLIRRTGLEKLVEQVGQHLLTLVQGPAGYGKTTLALTWADRFAAARFQIAWYSADTGDDEPSRFLFYLAQALARALPDQHDEILRFADFIRGGNAPLSIATLVNAIVESGEETFVFIDDFQLFSREDTLAIVSELLQHAPANLHLIILTRSNPFIATDRLRLNQQLLTVDAHALAFSEEETSRLFQEVGIQLPDHELHSVFEQTGGWPAALRIACLSLTQGTPEAGANLNLGASRSFESYFEKLLQGIPKNVRNFMTKTAFVEKLSIPLANQLFESRKVKAIVDLLLQHNILTPLDAYGQWFSYHALWRDYLSRKINGVEAPQLHLLAADWYYVNGYLSLAVRHALLGGHSEKALEWVENNAMALVKRGDLFTLRDWEKLIRALSSSQPVKLKLALAWALVLSMATEQAAALAGEVKRVLDQIRHPDEARLRWEIRMLESVISAVNEDLDAALADAAECGKTLPAGDPWLVNGLYNVLRLTNLHLGNWVVFYALPNNPYTAEEERANAFTEVYRYSLLGLAELVQGHLVTAENCLNRARELAAAGMAINNGPAALAESLLAQVHYERGQIAQASALLDGRLAVIDDIGFPDCVLRTYVTSARIAWLEERANAAWSLLEHAEAIAARRNWHRITAGILLEKIRIALLQNHLDAAQGLALRIKALAVKHGKRNSGPITGLLEYSDFSDALIALKSGNCAQATALLQPLYAAARARCSHLFAIRAGTLLAIAYMLVGKPLDAVLHFSEVLESAATEQAERSILDQGSAVLQLTTLCLSQRFPVRRSGQANRFALYLKAKLEESSPAATNLDTASSGLHPLEELTPKELKVLRELASGRTNKEIARSIGLAPETIKFHLKNIFVKLSVERRTQAVRRAQLLGLLGN